MNIFWQSRRSGLGPVAIRNGLESPWTASVAALLTASSSVTLLSKTGHEVLVTQLIAVAEREWSGTVAKVAAGEEFVRLGTTVKFDDTNVYGGTLK